MINIQQQQTLLMSFQATNTRTSVMVQPFHVFLVLNHMGSSFHLFTQRIQFLACSFGYFSYKNSLKSTKTSPKTLQVSFLHVAFTACIFDVLGPVAVEYPCFVFCFFV